MAKNPLKISIFMIGIFILCVVALKTFQNGLNLNGVIDFIEWVTLYILPWIFLYWFIKYVKQKI